MNKKNMLYLLCGVAWTMLVGPLYASTNDLAPRYNDTLHYSNEKREPYDGRDPKFAYKLKGYYSFKSKERYARTAQWYKDTYRPYCYAAVDTAQREEEYQHNKKEQGKKIVEQLGEWDEERLAMLKPQEVENKVESVPKVAVVPMTTEASSLPTFIILLSFLSICVGIMLSRKKTHK